MNLEIKILERQDISALNKLQEKYFDKQTRENFEFVLGNDNYLFLLALINNEIIAYAGVSISYERSDLLCVCVEKDYRNEGVAKALLNKIFNDLKEKGVQEVLLEVNENNTPAINLYFKLGFLEIHRRKNYYGKDTAVIMRKEL